MVMHGSDVTGTPALGGLARAGTAVLGAVAVVVGIVLVLSPFTAVRTLALLVALSLVVAGLLEILSPALRRNGAGVLLGLVLVIGGILAMLWPGITLWTLALITGIALIVHGVSRAAVAILFRSSIPAQWGWMLAAGVLNVVIGVFALAWPAATVLVLALLLGIQIMVFGVLTVVAAVRRPGT